MNKMINYIMSKSYSNFILELNRGKSIRDINNVFYKIEPFHIPWIDLFSNINVNISIQLISNLFI